MKDIRVPDAAGAVQALQQLEAELGGTWAFGVGDRYPEDYTVFWRYGEVQVRTGDGGGNWPVALIRIGMV